MKKAILISIRPEWVEKILNGEKTIEIRRNMPKCELPIDVYIYCSKGDMNLYKVIRENYVYFSGVVAEPFDTQIGFSLTKEKLDKKYRDNIEDGFSDIFTNLLNGKVVAKFTLNKVEKLEYQHIEEDSYQGWTMCAKFSYSDIQDKCCMEDYEIDEYLDFCNGYAWHIDNLQIFDKPMELSDFAINVCKYMGSAIDNNECCANHSKYGCNYKIADYNEDNTINVFICSKITPLLNKPPQSWQYVYIGE